MGTLEGRVAIVTGAGRGLGREHALRLAAEGAKVVVNDLGGDVNAQGSDRAVAQVVADEICAAGGEAVANTDSVADWDGAKRMVDQAIETFGDLHVVVNNAGILRDRLLVNMSEAEWDAVIAVHLKGHFCMTRHAAAYWREQSKAGEGADRSLIHTTSTSGLFGNAGQANYGAAKSGIASFSQIVAMELGRYGIRSNAIAPTARTQMTMETPGLAEKIAAPADGSFDKWHPANVSSFIAYLASPECPFSGETFHVWGGRVTRIRSWTAGEAIESDERWSVDGLIDAGGKLAGPGAERPYIEL